MGRCTKDHTVDVDLSLEGPAWKVSRRQGTIRLRNNGDFFLSSEGKRPIFVDSRPILAGNKMKLNNNSVIEVTIAEHTQCVYVQCWFIVRDFEFVNICYFLIAGFLVSSCRLQDSGLYF